MGEPRGGAERRDRSGLRVEGNRRCAVSRRSGPLAGAALLGALVAARGIPAAGQEPPPRPPVVGEACSHPDFHAFDYWLGRWTVRNPDGDAIGHSHVTRVSDGCAVLEEWTDALGGTGTSLTFLEDRDTGAWLQTWVGGYGWIQDFRGGVVDGVMTLAGNRTTPQGSQRHRIRWVPLEGGRVEQQMDVSRDGGATWQPGFRGLYVPLGDSAVADRLTRLRRTASTSGRVSGRCGTGSARSCGHASSRSGTSTPRFATRRSSILRTRRSCGGRTRWSSAGDGSQGRARARSGLTTK
jgi:hypothetical protein